MKKILLILLLFPFLSEAQPTLFKQQQVENLVSFLSTITNGKIDTVYRKGGTDSVFIKKNGVSLFAFIDSIGSGGVSSTVIANGNYTTVSGTGVILDPYIIDINTLIPATFIADGSVSSVEFQYINTLTSNAQTQINSKITANSPITGATKTKITYDANGLVTAGANATTTDIAASTDKNYVTDAQQTIIGNTSGTNTGDQTITLTGDVSGTGTGTFATTIGAAKVLNSMISGSVDAAKINTGIVSNTEFNYLDGVNSVIQTQIDSKQATIGFAPEDVANKATDLTSNDNTHYSTTKAVQDAINSVTNGQDWKTAAKYSSTTTLPTNVYNNGSSGVGATLTGLSFGAITFDGNTPTVGDRVLIKNEAIAANNGIYTVTTVGTIAAVYVLTRAVDYDQSSEINAGDGVFILAGTLNASTSWAMTTSGTITIGTTAINFAQIGANAQSVVITNDNATNATMYPAWVTSSSGNLVFYVSSTKLSFNPSTGNLTATLFTGNLTGNVTGNVSGTAPAGSLTGTILNSGVVTSSLTSVGTLGSLTIGGTLAMSSNNITMTGSLAATGNRVLKGWFTDGEFTNVPTVGGTSLPLKSDNLSVFASTTSAQLIGVISNETGSGALVFGTSPTLTTPVIASFTNTGMITTPTITSTLVGYVLTTTASSSTPTPTGDARDNRMTITALAAAPTFGVPSGTITDGNTLLIRMKDNATARALTWNAIYRAGTVLALPTTTTISKTMYVQFVYNSADTKWDLIGLTDGLFIPIWLLFAFTPIRLKRKKIIELTMFRQAA